MKHDTVYRIAVFASGNGTNAESLINYFNSNSGSSHSGVPGSVELVVCNNEEAGVLRRAKNHHVPYALMTKAQLCGGGDSHERHGEIPVVTLLREWKIDVIILAGYLLKIPEEVVRLYRGRIVNIHPALLPSYGGKGMYGERVHRAVLADKAIAEEKDPNAGPFYSGITIHIVDEEFDHGEILFQSRFILDKNETLESLTAKIHLQEQANFARVVSAWLKTL